MKKAWIENNVVRDVCEGDPKTLYRPEIAANYVAEVPDDIVNGASLIDGVWVNPVYEVYVVENNNPIPIISPVEFKLLFTPQERLAIKTARTTDEILDDLFTILDDPRLKEVNLNLESNKAVMAYLEGKGLITAERKAEIMTGIMK